MLMTPSSFTLYSVPLHGIQTQRREIGGCTISLLQQCFTEHCPIIIRNKPVRCLSLLTSKCFEQPTNLFFVVLSISQFHNPFWTRRTLSNMFALFPSVLVEPTLRYVSRTRLSVTPAASLPQHYPHCNKHSYLYGRKLPGSNVPTSGTATSSGPN